MAAGGEGVEDAGDVAGLHAAKDDQRSPGQAHVDERLLGAEAEAPDGGEAHIEAVLVDGLGERVVKAFGAVAGSTGSHADADARPGRQQFGHAGFAGGVEGADVLDADDAAVHSFLPLRCSTSRWRACSFMWP